MGRSPVAIKAEELKQKLESIVLIANSPMVAASDAAPSRSPCQSPIEASGRPSPIDAAGLDQAWDDRAQARVLSRSPAQPGTPAAAQELRAARARLSAAANAAAHLISATSPKGASSREAAVLTPASRARY